MQVKENQGALLERLRQLAAQRPPIERSFERTAGRARQEDRTVETFALDGAFEDTDWAPYLATAIRVERRTLIRNAATGLWKSREETAFYISSAELSAPVFAAAIRAHWGIENRNHYVRDTAFAEDNSRIRSNPGIMARARSFALNILRTNGAENIALTVWNNALSLDNILKYKAI